MTYDHESHKSQYAASTTVQLILNENDFDTTTLHKGFISHMGQNIRLSELWSRAQAGDGLAAQYIEEHPNKFAKRLAEAKRPPIEQAVQDLLQQKQQLALVELSYKKQYEYMVDKFGEEAVTAELNRQKG